MRNETRDSSMKDFIVNAVMPSVAFCLLGTFFIGVCLPAAVWIGEWVWYFLSGIGTP